MITVKSEMNIQNNCVIVHHAVAEDTVSLKPNENDGHAGLPTKHVLVVVMNYLFICLCYSRLLYFMVHLLMTCCSVLLFRFEVIKTVDKETRQIKEVLY